MSHDPSVSPREALAARARDGAVVIHPANSVPAELAVNVSENRGEDNWVVVDASLERRTGPVEARFYGSSNTLYLGSNAILRGVMRFHGSGSTTSYDGEGRDPCFFQITHWSSDTAIRIGAGTTSNGTQLIAMGDGARISIGADCMFAANTWVMTSDMHCIVDSRTGEVLNSHGNIADVAIGGHVWIGQDSMILHGVQVGHGAVIGAKSLVKSTVPDTAVVAGTPARVVRENATWLRSHVFLPREFERVKEALEKLQGLPPG